MLKKIFISFIILASPDIVALQTDIKTIGKRVLKLEKKVVNIDKRVKNIENKIGITKFQTSQKENPLNIIYISKDKLIGATRAGIRLNFKIYNPTQKRIYAFMGDIILKDENGNVFYTYRFYYDQLFEPQSYIDAVILIMDTQGDIYFKLLKIDKIKVEFINQKIYLGDEI